MPLDDVDTATAAHASQLGGLDGDRASHRVGQPTHDRLGICSAPECDRVFVDVSRNGTKRFCSSACQNRVKAAAFRARQRGATT